MRSLVTLLFMFAVATSAFAQTTSPEITVSVDRTAEVGQAVTVMVSLSGPAGADCDLLALPDVEGGRLDVVSGPSSLQEKTVVNGRVSTRFTMRWQLRLIPERTGRIYLPALQFSCRGAVVSSKATYIDVSESSIEPGTVHLSIEPTSRELWVGQIFDVEIEAGVLLEQWRNVVRGGLMLALPWQADEDYVLLLGATPTSRGASEVFLNGDAARLAMSNSEQVRDGREYHLLTRRLRFLARAPGTVDLRDSRFSTTIATEVRNVRDPLSIFGGTRQATRTAVLDAYGEGEPIVIRPLPLDGQPASFTNAVGDFRFFVNATPRSLAVGETCRLTMEVRGVGNLEFIEWPAFSELDANFRVFDKNEEKEDTYRRLVWDVAPLNDRVDEIPSLAFSAFNPDTGEYVELVSPAIELDVEPGGGGGLTDLEPSQAILHDLETIRETLPEPRPEPWPTWWLWAPAVLALIGTELFTRRAAWRRSNPAEIARRGARRKFENELSEAGDAGAAAGAFARFLAARFNGPPAGMSAREAAGILRERDAALADELVRVVSGWEAGYLGGASIDTATVAAEARALADRVEAAS